MKKNFDLKNAPLNLVLLLFALFAVFFFASVSQKQYEIRGRAQASAVVAQAQCTTGDKVQMSIYFANPETVTVNVTVQIFLQSGTVTKNYDGIGPGQTKSDIVPLTVTSVDSGDVVFGWYAADPKDNLADQEATTSYGGVSCAAVATAIPIGGTNPTPAVGNNPSPVISLPQDPSDSEPLPSEIDEPINSPTLLPTFSCLGACITPPPTFVPPPSNEIITDPKQPIEEPIEEPSAPINAPNPSNGGVLQLLIQLIIALIKILFNR